MNSNGPNSAQVTNLINGEWPAKDLVTNYTTMQNAGLQPWRSFNKVQFSWNESAVAFNIVDNTTRIATKKERSIPSAGQALKINTWSIGDKTYGRGPPIHNTTRSHILWVRAFFNSTEMTESQHASFNERCLMTAPCSTQDTTLRGYTTYAPSALIKGKSHQSTRASESSLGSLQLAAAPLASSLSPAFSCVEHLGGNCGRRMPESSKFRTSDLSIQTVAKAPRLNPVRRHLPVYPLVSKRLCLHIGPLHQDRAPILLRRLTIPMLQHPLYGMPVVWPVW